MPDKKRQIDTYTVIADKVPATINVWSSADENVPLYEIVMPDLGVGTEALLKTLMEELAEKVPVEIEEILDPERVERIKNQFFSEVKNVVKDKLPTLDENNVDVLSGILLHRMYGLGFIDIIMADDWLEELAINGIKQPISVYHKKHGWCKTTKKIKSEEDVYNLSSQIGRKVGREINSLNPIMDAHLVSGDRVSSTLFPISTGGNTITIRRFARNPWTPISLIKNKTMSKEIAAFLWQAIQYELNVLVAGGTASGKTSALNALCCFIPPVQRIISIEDTREITLPKDLEWNWVPLTTRRPNPEGQGAVTMLDLMVASLRMRPDRIIVGEVRRKQQAETMFEAMHTGHSVYTTIHADTVQQVKRRLIEPPIEIPRAEIEVLQLILTQYRDRRKGIRRSLELAEIVSGGKEDLEINYLYRWRPRIDGFEKVNNSVRVFEDLNLHTGMTPKEINDDLKQKQDILQWMLKNNIINIDAFGKVMRIYYKQPGTLIEHIKKKKKISLIL